MDRVVEAISGIDDKVRRDQVKYKNKEGLQGNDMPNSFVKIERPVQRLFLLQAHDETPNCDARAGNVSSKI